MHMLRRAVFRTRPVLLITRCYVALFSSIIQPLPPPRNNKSDKTIGESLFDTKCLAALSGQTDQTPLTTLIRQYTQRAGNIFNHIHLPYESTPAEDKRVKVQDSKDVMHCATDMSDDKVTVSSGFLLNALQQDSEENECLVLTCAHTLEEVRHTCYMLTIYHSIL